jgi:hypothetical protein
MRITVFEKDTIVQAISHEYVTENIVRFFGAVFEFTPKLTTVIENLNQYCV